MYIEMISYKLAEGIDESFLRDAAKDIFKTWMSKQSGFIKWEINKLTDDTFQDHVYWESKEVMKLAGKNMGEIPKDHKWFACYDMKSVSSKGATSVLSLKAGS